MIEIHGLTKRYGSHTVLDNIDFTVEPGSIAAVVGRSGAGKSTLFRCVNLLERPTSGTICVDGRELTNLSSRELRAARRAIGTVFQSANLLRRLTGAGINQKYKIYAPPAPRAFAGQLVVGTKYLHDPQIQKLIKVFLDPRVQPYLRTTQNPRLKDQLIPVSSSNN